MKKRNKQLQRVLILFGCVAILATMIAMPISATKIGYCSAVNFFDVNAVVREEEYSIYSKNGNMYYYAYADPDLGLISVNGNFYKDKLQNNNTLILPFSRLNTEIFETNTQYYIDFDIINPDDNITIEFCLYDHIADQIMFEFKKNLFKWKTHFTTATEYLCGLPQAPIYQN